jgi:hypothetical protein
MHKSDVRDNRLVQDFRDNDLGRDAVLTFADSPLFHDNEHRYEESFFGRRLRPHVLKFLDFSTPLSADNLKSYAAFSANRVLFAMNETSFMLLPVRDKLAWEDFDTFYSEERISAAAIGSAYLERFLFSFLDSEIRLSENWSFAHIKEYFMGYVDETRRTQQSRSASAIANSKDPMTTAKDWLVQLSPDFLLESSPMARYASGNYGGIGSSLFKIIIDELGYGEFHKKHSTIFERLLVSAGLDPSPHHYWQYYLNSSLMLANYYNTLTRNKRNIFKYIGAIFQAETSFITSCRLWANALKAVIPSIDTSYFREHCHIDVDHSRMAFDELVAPAIERYGERAALEIVRGFEEARWISDFAEGDFVDQVTWKDNAEENKKKHDRIFPAVAAAFAAGKVKRAPILEPLGELSITHSHDSDELCHVVRGNMEFLNGFERSTTLRDDEGIVIQHNRLHGALIHSDQCQYEIYTIGDVRTWL